MLSAIKQIWVMVCVSLVLTFGTGAIADSFIDQFNDWQRFTFTEVDAVRICWINEFGTLAFDDSGRLYRDRYVGVGSAVVVVGQSDYVGLVKIKTEFTTALFTNLDSQNGRLVDDSAEVLTLAIGITCMDHGTYRTVFETTYHARARLTNPIVPSYDAHALDRLEYRRAISQKISLIALEATLPGNNDQLRGKVWQLKTEADKVVKALTIKSDGVSTQDVVDASNALTLTRKLAKDNYARADKWSSRDLTGQFRDDCADQQDTQLCPVLATVGQLEAAYWRQYGVKIDFSEMHVLAPIIEGFLSVPLGDSQTPELVRPSNGRFSGKFCDAYSALEHIARSGICTEDAMPFREPQTVNNLLSDQTSTRMGYGWLSVNRSSSPSEMVTERENRTREYEKLFAKNDAIEAEEDHFRRAFAGFVAVPSGSFTYEEVLRLLQFGIPIGMSSPVKNATNSHDMVVSGYELNDRGKLQLSIRDSYGGTGSSSPHTQYHFLRSSYQIQDDFGKPLPKTFGGDHVVLAPDDIDRICFDRSLAIPVIQPLCS